MTTTLFPPVTNLIPWDKLYPAGGLWCRKYFHAADCTTSWSVHRPQCSICQSWQSQHFFQLTSFVIWSFTKNKRTNLIGTSIVCRRAAWLFNSKLLSLTLISVHFVFSILFNIKRTLDTLQVGCCKSLYFQTVSQQILCHLNTSCKPVNPWVLAWVLQCCWIWLYWSNSVWPRRAYSSSYRR